METNKKPSRNKNFLNNKHVKWVVSIAVASIVFTVILLAAIFTPPEVEKRYIEAISLFEQQKYLEAEKIFSEIDPYKESTNYILECKYLNAKQLVTKKEFKKAIELYIILGNHKDSTTLLIGVKYKYASDCFFKNDFENAALYYSQCGSYLDSQQKEIESNYKAGLRAFENGNFNKATQYLGKNTSYLDSTIYLEASKTMISMQGIWREYGALYPWLLIAGWKVSVYDEWGKLKYNNVNIKFENNILSWSNNKLENGKFNNTSIKFWKEGASLPIPKIGMIATEVKETIWGNPIKINTTTNAYGTSEQWVYKDSHYLYFTNGKLTSIQS